MTHSSPKPVHEGNREGDETKNIEAPPDGVFPGDSRIEFSTLEKENACNEIHV